MRTGEFIVIPGAGKSTPVASAHTSLGVLWVEAATLAHAMSIGMKQGCCNHVIDW
jgi:hypothetical protein